MNKITRKIILLVIPFLSIMVFIKQANTFAQDSNKSEIFAISSLGEKLDFRQAAIETAKYQNAQSYAEKIMPPQIPRDLKLTEDIVSPNMIIGDDDRIKLTDTTYFPWTTVAKIQGNFESFIFNCTGWMLGPSTVVTSAHCIYDYGGTNSYAKNVIVTPALNSDSQNSEPFGHCEANKAWIINLRESTGDHQYDYGVYALRCRVGEQTGNLGYRVINDIEIEGEQVNLTGYPMDLGGSTMWFGLGFVLETSSDFMYYDNDATGGQSGAPVWELINDSCQVCDVAIHSGSGDLGHNVGVRITNDVFDFLFSMQQWIYYYPAYMPIILKNSISGQNYIYLDNPYPEPEPTEIPPTEIPYP